MFQKEFFSLPALFFLLFDQASAVEWNPVPLSNQFIVPSELNPVENVYSAQIPTLPPGWERTPECDKFEPTNVHWKSGLFSGIKGLSFKGLVFKLPEPEEMGDPLNSFAIFFHERECYRDGSEYGWVFDEYSLPKGSFYVCNQCNLPEVQKWAKWPSESTPTFEVLEGDAEVVKTALQNSGIYRYWNIEVTEEGDFMLELMNPDTSNAVSVTLKKPSWFPNLYNTSGYVTIVAKKQGQTILTPSPVMHVDHVRILQ